MERYVKNVNIPHPSQDENMPVHLQNPSVTSAPRQPYKIDPEPRPRQRSSSYGKAVSTNNNPRTVTNNTQPEPANHDGLATTMQDTPNARTSSQNFSGSTSNKETGKSTQQTASTAGIPLRTITQSTAAGITGSKGANSAHSSSSAPNSPRNEVAGHTSGETTDYDWDTGDGSPGFSSPTISTNEGRDLAQYFSSESPSDDKRESDQGEGSSGNQSACNDETLKDHQDEASKDGDSETLRDKDVETPMDTNHKTPNEGDNKTPTDDDNEILGDDKNETPEDDNNGSPSDDNNNGGPGDDDNKAPSDDNNGTSEKDRTETPGENNDGTPSDDDNETAAKGNAKIPVDDKNETSSDDDFGAPSSHARDHKFSSEVRKRRGVKGNASENQSWSSGNDCSSTVGQNWEKLDSKKSHEDQSESKSTSFLPESKDYGVEKW